MRVRCIAHSGKSLPDNYIDSRLTLYSTQKFDITVGKEYVVYGLTTYFNKVWYYICDDNRDYPIWYPAPLFEVVDNRASSFWKYRFDLADNSILFAFEEWVSDLYFYDRLTDGEAVEVATFMEWKKRMDDEAASE